MSVGKKIRFFRRKRGMTQKALGEAVGFPETSADVRVAQYEGGARTPKREAMGALASVLGVSSDALLAPDGNDVGALMQALFALEDACGVVVHAEGEDVVLRIPCGTAEASGISAGGMCAGDAGSASPAGGVAGEAGADTLRRALLDWACQADGLASDEVSRDGYDEWRYSFPS